MDPLRSETGFQASKTQKNSAFYPKGCTHQEITHLHNSLTVSLSWPFWVYLNPKVIQLLSRKQ